MAQEPPSGTGRTDGSSLRSKQMEWKCSLNRKANGASLRFVSLGGIGLKCFTVVVYKAINQYAREMVLV